MARGPGVVKKAPTFPTAQNPATGRPSAAIARGENDPAGHMPLAMQAKGCRSRGVPRPTRSRP